MEVDRVHYIFGSFTRKRQDSKRKSVEQSSLSAGSSPLHLPSRSTYSRPTSTIQNGDLVIAPRTSAYHTAKPVKGWECGLCRKQLSEPRILGCLHSFCTHCLQGLHQEGELEIWSDADGFKRLLLDDSRSGSGGGSAGSGYESDLRNHSDSDSSWNELRDRPHKYGILNRKVSGKSVQFLLCPTCGYETQIPLGGIAALPLNTILIRKMVAADDESDKSSILCDLCTTDTKAESRCSQCLLSVCNTCSEAHARQKETKRHSLHPLQPAPVRFCSQHPRAELCVYCATCQQVICRECCLLSHGGHALASAARAAAERARRLRDACARARRVPAHAHRLAGALDARAHEDDARAARLEADVAAWAERYRRAVEAHARALAAQAGRARARARRLALRRRRRLAARAALAHHALAVAEEVLSEGREDELLALSDGVLRRLEWLTELTALAEPPACELRFAPTAPVPGDVPLVGRLLADQADPEQCVITTEGLQDLRVDEEHEVTLELRDRRGERVWGGAGTCGGDGHAWGGAGTCGDGHAWGAAGTCGERVAAYLRRRDSSARPAAAAVRLRADGRYAVRMRAPRPGAYLLAVTLNDKPIKGSPFLCAARVARSHSGQYHCCAFCSSGGRKDAECGCGATMEGYKGCGHGHAGHPGARHWSCCGRTARAAACARAPAPAAHYQVSL